MSNNHAKFRYDRPKRFNIIAICLMTAVVLSALIAMSSDYGRHPDETNHFAAVQYYKDRFLPPAIGDPAAENSYSVWGVSYLNYHWVEYFLAGKFTALVSPLVPEEFYAARLFNVFLFLCLSIFFIRQSDPETLIIPAFLVVTPQVWYVFSYINNDAFALFISVLAAYQIANSESLLNKFLSAGEPSGYLKGSVFAILIGLLLIGKTNYYVFLLFAAAWLLHKHSPVNFQRWRPAIDLSLLKRYAFILVVAMSVLTFRCALDFYVNGETNFAGVSYLNYFLSDFEDGKSRLMAYQEEKAGVPFKPSTIENDLEKSDPSVKLKAKGVSFSDILFERKFLEITFRSSVGVYGYVNIFASKSYYRAVAFIYSIFALYLLFCVIRVKNYEALTEFALTVVFCFLTVFISAYLSWSYAFQPQGRYLFPMIPMICVYVYSNRRSIDQRVFSVFVVSAFLLSVYSFVFVAFPNLHQ